VVRSREVVPSTNTDRSSASSAKGSFSSALFRWLFDDQLVDEMTLFIFSVVVGQGTRLFPDTRRDRALELVESRATPSGVTIQVYRPAGRPQYATATK
jgi:dihydrofolate reductase